MSMRAKQHPALRHTGEIRHRMPRNRVAARMRASLLVAFACGMLPALAAEPTTNACPAQPFQVEIERGDVRDFDVRTLRTERPDLYRILGSRFFLESAMGEAAALIYRPEDVFDAMDRAKATGGAELFLRFVLLGGIQPALQRAFMACGTDSDHYAALLSVRIDREQGERLATMLADPAFDQLATIAPRLSGRVLPRQLRASQDAVVEKARLEIIEACEQYGVPVATCRAFPPLSRRH